jgi:hypothetical protein
MVRLNKLSGAPHRKAAVRWLEALDRTFGCETEEFKRCRKYSAPISQSECGSRLEG